MKESNKILEQIKNVLESDGKTKIYFKEQNGKILLKDFLETIVEYWGKLNNNQKNILSDIILNEKPDYLIGNEKWILYNYICEFQGSVTIRAGNYAFYKIKKMLDDIKNIEHSTYNEIYIGMLNGEEIKLIKNNYSIEKNEIIISNNKYSNNPKKLILYFK